MWFGLNGLGKKLYFGLNGLGKTYDRIWPRLMKKIEYPLDEILKALGLAISIAFTLFNELSGGAICFATPALWYGIYFTEKTFKKFFREINFVS